MPDLPSSEARTKPAGNYPERVRRDCNELNHTERMVLSLQLLGLKQKQIAERLGKHRKHITKICGYRRYREAFERKLAEIDEAGFRAAMQRMRPQALRAIEDALQSEDPELALKAAVKWYELMDAGAFRQGAVPRRPDAHDIAQELMRAGSGGVRGRPFAAKSGEMRSLG